MANFRLGSDLAPLEQLVRVKPREQCRSLSVSQGIQRNVAGHGAAQRAWPNFLVLS